MAAFLVLFFIPMGLRSTVPSLRLPAPPVLGKLHNIACLFTHKPEGWSSYHVQVRYPGEVGWETLDQRELFPLQPFGRRTRLHRLLVAWGAKASPRTEDLARWILVHHGALHPEDPPPVAIRFARSWVIPSRDQPPPEHGWVHPKWREVPPARRRIIVSYMRDTLFATSSGSAGPRSGSAGPRSGSAGPRSGSAGPRSGSGGPRSGSHP